MPLAQDGSKAPSKSAKLRLCQRCVALEVFEPTKLPIPSRSEIMPDSMMHAARSIGVIANSIPYLQPDKSVSKIDMMQSMCCGISPSGCLAVKSLNQKQQTDCSPILFSPRELVWSLWAMPTGLRNTPESENPSPCLQRGSRKPQKHPLSSCLCVRGWLWQGHCILCIKAVSRQATHKNLRQERTWPGNAARPLPRSYFTAMKQARTTPRHRGPACWPCPAFWSSVRPR